MANEANNKIDPELAKKEGELIKNAVKEVPGIPGMIGKGIDAVDKVTGGKGSELVGKAANNAVGGAPHMQALRSATNRLKGDGLGNSGGLDDGMAGKTNPADAVKGVDGAANNAQGLGLPEKKNSTPLGGLGNKSKSNSKSSSSSINPEDEDDLEDTTGTIQLAKVPTKIKLALLGIVGGVIILLLPLILIVAIFTSIGDVAADFFSGIGEKFVSFFEGAQYTTEENFYKEIDKVRKNILSKDGVCIDANLIIAALTANKDFDEALEQGEEETESEEGYTYTKKMQKQIALLGAMQVKHQTFSLDKNASPKCDNNRVPELVTESNKDAFKTDLLHWLTTNDADYLIKNIASDSPRSIANNDQELNVNFFKKKVSQEMNYAYYIYYPPFNPNDNTCDDNYAKSKLRDMNSDAKAELDIGTLKDMKDHVFYWNLVDQFIPDYYADYLPQEEGPERTDAIYKIADDIYALYETMGPNQNCNTGGVYSYSCSYTIDNTDVSNIKVKLMDNDFNPLDEDLLNLEDYIAGVVYGENGFISSENTEALRAQAVAARSYLLKRTQGILKNYITTTANGTTVLSIRNSNSDQVYCNPHTGCYVENNVYHSADSAHPATKVALNASQMEMLNNALASVTGQVLTDTNGNIIQTGYNSDIQTTWNELSKAGSDYRSILMETYEDADSINSNCIYGGAGYGGGSVSGMFSGVATECNSFFTYGDPFYWGDPVNNKFTYGTYNPFQSYGIQCTWYTYGRALKALVEYGNLTVSQAKTKLFFRGNAGEWWKENLDKDDDNRFQYSSNLEDVREGSIVVWVGGHSGNVWCSSINDYCGHVAFVERVVRNSDGTVKEVSISQANPDKCRWTTYTSLEAFNRNGSTTGNRHIAGFIYLFDR